MNSIIDASEVDLEESRILFDTNIWIFIYGFCNPASHKAKAYSNAYERLLKRTNRIVVNDYVLGEFCNRCARFEYEIQKNGDADFPPYKHFRSSPDFVDTMESIRDTCLHILDDCEYVRVGAQNCDARAAVTSFCEGTLDFSDIILTEYCRLENLILMTDDADFKNRGVSLITHNRKLLQKDTVPKR